MTSEAADMGDNGTAGAMLSLRALRHRPSDPVVLLGPDGTVVDVGPGVERLLGRVPPIGTTAAELERLVHPADDDRLAALREAMGTPGCDAAQARLRVLVHGGEWDEIVVSAEAVDEPGVGRGVLVSALTAPPQRLPPGAAPLPEVLPDALEPVGALAADGRFASANPSLCRLVEYHEHELRTRALATVAHPDDAPSVTWLVEWLSSGLLEGARWETRLMRADGLVVPVVVSMARVLDALGRVAHIVCQVREAVTAPAPLPVVGGVDEVAVVESVTDLIFQVDADLRWTYLNQAWTSITGQPVEESLGTSALEVVHPDDRDTAREQARAVLEGETDRCHIDVRYVDPDDGERLVEIFAHPVVDDEGRRIGLSGVVLDMSERRGVETELRRERDFSTAVVETAGCVVVVLDREGRIERFNRAAETASQRVADEVRGLHLSEAFPAPPGNPGLRPLLEGPLTEHASEPVDIPWVTPDGDVRVLTWSATVLPGDRVHDAHIVATSLDVTERRAVEAQLEFQAFHDPLTGLPNRTLLLERLRHGLTRLDRRDQEVAVLFLDLNRFKIINDTYGHDAGDRLLVAAANRIQTVLRPSDTVARFGGDEFVVLCEDLADASHALEIADRIVAVLQAPFLLGHTEVAMSTSIGVALASHSGDDPETLLRDADAAMYRAKDQGRERITGQSHGRPRRHDARAPSIDDLRRALLRDELHVVYQPQVALPDGRIVAVEALARWHHPELGVIQPHTFLPLAESTGLIVPLGIRVLETACEQARAWSRIPMGRPVTVSVNLSRRELADAGLRDAVEQVLGRTGTEPSQLCIEITESGVLRNPESTAVAVASLRQLGVRVSIDDVGTSDTALGYLDGITVDEVKVDRSLVRDLGEDPDDDAAVAAVVDAAHVLDLRAVGEGVEQESQLTALRLMGCDVVQGFFFAGPQPADVITRLLEPDLRWPTEG